MKYFLLFVFYFGSAFANPRTQLNNSILFFEKETLTQTFPKTLCGPIKIQIPVNGQQPANAITKVFEQTYACQEINVKLSLYFHSQNGSEYYSQQVNLHIGKQLLSLCSGYFPTGQNFLIPGACAGVSGQKLFGFSLVK